MSNDIGPGGCLFAAIILIAIIALAPFVTIWCINTLIITPIKGSEGCLSYTLFSAHWWAALISGGILVAPFKAMRGKD